MAKNNLFYSNPEIPKKNYAEFLKGSKNCNTVHYLSFSLSRAVLVLSSMSQPVQCGLFRFVADQTRFET